MFKKEMIERYVVSGDLDFSGNVELEFFLFIDCWPPGWCDLFSVKEDDKRNPFTLRIRGAEFGQVFFGDGDRVAAPIKFEIDGMALDTWNKINVVRTVKEGRVATRVFLNDVEVGCGETFSMIPAPLEKMHAGCFKVVSGSGFAYISHLEVKCQERFVKTYLDQSVRSNFASEGALEAFDDEFILDVCNSAEFASLPPSQIVPKLADQGRYLASESSFYRILRADGQQHHRGRAKPPMRRKPPASYKASAPCEVWTWDITWMPGPVAGMFFYLYLIVDIFSRKIVGWEVHDRESAELAAVLIRQAVLAEGCTLRPLVLHADNGSPMKGATMKVTMEKLGITASYSRPRVSNDNPFSEALFRTCKYRPSWPTKGFATKSEAQAWVKSFAGWYNGEHLHSATRFVTPAARHAGHDRAMLANRAQPLCKCPVTKPATLVRQNPKLATCWTRLAQSGNRYQRT